jgi:hypothetical protein
MALQNEISISFTAAELQQIDDAIAQIEAIVQPKVVQLTAEQNGVYGKLGNENEGWVETIYQDCKVMPSLVPANVVDTKEWDADELARKQLSPRISRLQALLTNLDSTNRLIGFDLYTTCRMVYKNVKALMEMGVAGTKEYYNKWSVQFPGRKGGSKTTKP